MKFSFLSDQSRRWVSLGAVVVFFCAIASVSAAPSGVFPSQAPLSAPFPTAQSGGIAKAGGLVLGATEPPLSPAVPDLVVTGGKMVVGAGASAPAELTVAGSVGASEYCTADGSVCKTVAAINQANAGNATDTGFTIPSGAIIIVPDERYLSLGNAGCPSGFSLYSTPNVYPNLYHRFPRGASSPADITPGGGGAHVHAVPKTNLSLYGLCGSNLNPFRNCKVAPFVISSDTTVSPAADDTEAFTVREYLPPYLNVLYCKKL